MMLVQSKMMLVQSILIFYLHLNNLVESKTYTLNFTRIPSVLRLRFNKAPAKSINSIVVSEPKYQSLKNTNQLTLSKEESILKSYLYTTISTLKSVRPYEAVVFVSTPSMYLQTRYFLVRASISNFTG